MQCLKAVAIHCYADEVIIPRIHDTHFSPHASSDFVHHLFCSILSVHSTLLPSLLGCLPCRASVELEPIVFCPPDREEEEGHISPSSKSEGRLGPSTDSSARVASVNHLVLPSTAVVENQGGGGEEHGFAANGGMCRGDGGGGGEVYGGWMEEPVGADDWDRDTETDEEGGEAEEEFGGELWELNGGSDGCDAVSTDADVFSDIDDVVASLLLRQELGGQENAAISVSATVDACRQGEPALRRRGGTMLDVRGQARVVTGRLCRAVVWVGEKDQATTTGEASLQQKQQQQQQQQCSLSPALDELEAAVAGCLTALLAALEAARLACSDVIVSYRVQRYDLDCIAASVSQCCYHYRYIAVQSLLYIALPSVLPVLSAVACRCCECMPARLPSTWLHSTASFPSAFCRPPNKEAQVPPRLMVTISVAGMGAASLSLRSPPFPLRCWSPWWLSEVPPPPLSYCPSRCWRWQWQRVIVTRVTELVMMLAPAGCDDCHIQYRATFHHQLCYGVRKLVHPC